jgi:hypothetical protein
MVKYSTDEMYQNALAQLNRIERDVVELLDELDRDRAEPEAHEVRKDYERLLLRVREATSVHDSLGRIVLQPSSGLRRTSKADATLQLNRAVVFQALAYVAAAHYLKRYPGVLGRDRRKPLEDARRLLLSGQLWRPQAHPGAVRRTAARLKRWILGRDPMGGADLDSRVDSAIHGQHAVAAIGHIKWSGLPRSHRREARRASDLLEMGVKNLQQRRLGYTQLASMPLRDVLSACARLELVLGLENSSAGIYLAKAVLACVRTSCFVSAAEQFSGLQGRYRDLHRCAREAREELSRAQRMLSEARQHKFWDLLRRIKRTPPKAPFELNVTAGQLRSVVDDFARLIRGGEVPYLVDRRAARNSGLAGYRRKLYALSRTSFGSPRFQRAMAARRRSAMRIAEQRRAA